MGAFFCVVRMKGKTKKPSVRASNGSCDALRGAPFRGIGDTLHHGENVNAPLAGAFLRGAVTLIQNHNGGV